MRYMMMFYEQEKTFAKRADPEHSGPYWGAWMAYIEALNASGIVVTGAGLEPPATATTLRVTRGERHVQDGPVAGTKEQLGGFFILETDSIETALAWAARSPAAADGAVEVRPVMATPSAASG